METKQRRAIIVGGSLGGLLAAATMRKIGWNVEVYERSPHELDSRGGGIVLQPDVLRAFNFAGVAHNRAHGVMSRDRIYLDRDDTVVSRHYLPQTQTSWNRLHGALLRHLPRNVVRPGHQLVRFEQDGQTVHAFFENGHHAQGDLLIAADGARSTVRRQVLPGTDPHYAGYVAWRGLVPEGALARPAAATLADSFSFQQGAEHLMLEYLVPGENESVEVGRRRWNWVWYLPVKPGKPLEALLTDRFDVKHAFSLPPGTPRQAAIDALRDRAKRLLAPTFQALVEATEEPFLQAILDLQVPQMVFGRVVLVGDAAFVPRPHTAGSTAKAAANAFTLAKALDGMGNEDIDSAIAQWQVDQLREGRDMTEWGVSLGNRIMGVI